MRKRVVLLAVPLGLMSIGLSGCLGGQDFDEKTLVYTERESDDFGFVDAPPRTRLGRQGPERFSPGDQMTFRAELLKGGKDVGDLDVTCAITKGGGFEEMSGTCHATATLAGGTLTLAAGGKVFADDKTEGSVVGGSGAYEGAIGGFTSTSGEDRPSRDTFHIFVPK
jgi:hypothetical protein